MPEPRSLADLVLHRYEVTPTEDELRLLPDSGTSDFHHQRDLLKARVAARLDELTEDRVAHLARDEAEWRLALLGEMVFECRRFGHWGGQSALPRLQGIRNALTKRLHNE